MYIHHHLGLGDHIICNGLVRGLLGTEAEIVLATEASCEEAVRHLYADTNVKLHLVSGDQQAEEEYRKHDSVLRVGFENCHTAGLPCRPDWEKAFYDYVGMSYEKRYELFHFPRSEEREQELLEKLALPDEFAFVNTATSKGSFDIEIDTQLPIVRLTRLEGITLLDWLVVLEKATEIHTVDTSVFQLAKQYKFDKRKVFYDVRTGRGDGTPFTFEDEGWEINVRTN